MIFPPTFGSLGVDSPNGTGPHLRNAVPTRCPRSLLATLGHKKTRTVGCDLAAGGGGDLVTKPILLQSMKKCMVLWYFYH